MNLYIKNRVAVLLFVSVAYFVRLNKVLVDDDDNIAWGLGRVLNTRTNSWNGTTVHRKVIGKELSKSYLKQRYIKSTVIKTKLIHNAPIRLIFDRRVLYFRLILINLLSPILIFKIRKISYIFQTRTIFLYFDWFHIIT